MPLYGNVVSLSTDGTVTVIAYPASKLQVKRQCLRDGRTPARYTFSVQDLPRSQPARELWRAIERWQSQTESDQDRIGPRVTFFDEDEAIAYNNAARLERPIISIPSPSSSAVNQTAALQQQISRSSSSSAGGHGQPRKYGHHHQHRRRKSMQEASLGSEAFPRRAVDVGLVWWTKDLHGSTA